MRKRIANTNGDRDKPVKANRWARDELGPPSARDEAWEATDGLPRLSRYERLPYPPIGPQRVVDQTSSWRRTVTPPQVLFAKPLGPPAYGSSPDLTRFTATLLYVPRFVRHLYRRLRSRMPFRLAWASARTRMRQYF